MKTLIVDRVKLFQQIIAGVLDDSNIEHVFAATGKEALALLEIDHFECICVSLYLDDIDGIALCQEIRKNRVYKYTPIVLLTSEIDPEKVSAAIAAGITDVFSKDRIHELVNFIGRFTQHTQPIDGRILLIEDDQLQVDFVTALFEARNLEVDAFDKAEDAWEAFLKNHYHLVITDLILAGEVNGMLLINKIRRLDDAKGDTPILTLTGVDDHSRRISLYHMGITDYVTKPIIEEELIVRVRNLINTQKARERENEYREAISSDDALRRAMKMEALGKMTGGIAHDYNNVLGVVAGFSQLLMMDLKDKPLLLDYATQIYNASKNAAALTSKLLAFTRSDRQGNTHLKVSDVVQDLQSMLEKTLTASIVLQVDLAADSWSVLTDRYDLENAVINMCINAKHAMESSGTLSIKTRNLDLNLDESEKVGLPPGQYVRLSVKDTGVGMDEETVKQVFNPFFSTKGDSGTGLGLTQVYGFAQRANGAIAVESKPGAGTEMILYFPRAEAGQSEVERDDEAVDIRDGKGTKVLVVDDENALRGLNCEILKQAGYEVLGVPNAKDALQVLGAQSFDVMLTDIIMPGMNGFDLADVVSDKYPNTRVILVSGYDKDIPNAEERRSRYRFRLNKPVDPRTLLVCIQDVLDQEHPSTMPKCDGWR